MQEAASLIGAPRKYYAKWARARRFAHNDGAGRSAGERSRFRSSRRGRGGRGPDGLPAEEAAQRERGRRLDLGDGDGGLDVDHAGKLEQDVEDELLIPFERRREHLDENVHLAEQGMAFEDLG